MSLASETINNPVIGNLVEFSLESENKDLRLEWIPYEEISYIESTQIDNVYCATGKRSYEQQRIAGAGKTGLISTLILLVGQSGAQILQLLSDNILFL